MDDGRGLFPIRERSLSRCSTAMSEGFTIPGFDLVCSACFPDLGTLSQPSARRPLSRLYYILKSHEAHFEHLRPLTEAHFEHLRVHSSSSATSVAGATGQKRGSRTIRSWSVLTLAHQHLIKHATQCVLLFGDRMKSRVPSLPSFRSPRFLWLLTTHADTFDTGHRHPLSSRFPQMLSFLSKALLVIPIRFYRYLVEHQTVFDLVWCSTCEFLLVSNAILSHPLNPPHNSSVMLYLLSRTLRIPTVALLVGVRK